MISYKIKSIEKNKKKISICLSALLVLVYAGFQNINKNNNFVYNFPPAIMCDKCEVKKTKKKIVFIK